MSLAQETLSRLAAIVGESRVRTDADSLKTWGCDWTKMYTPAPSAIVFPSSVEQVQAVVLLANEAGFAIVPSGGRTGLSAGAAPRARQVRPRGAY